MIENRSQDQLTTLGRAAKKVGLSYDAVEALVDRGHVEVVQLPGGNRLVRPGDVARIVQASTRPATSPIVPRDLPGQAAE